MTLRFHPVCLAIFNSRLIVETNQIKNEGNCLDQYLKEAIVLCVVRWTNLKSKEGFNLKNQLNTVEENQTRNKQKRKEPCLG